MDQLNSAKSKTEKKSGNNGGAYFQWKQKEIPKQREKDKNYDKQMNYFSIQRNKITTGKNLPNTGERNRRNKINKKERENANKLQ